MGRKKITIQPIKNDKLRAVTFNKRKVGLLKKAAELSMLCNVQLVLIFTDGNGNLVNFCSPGPQVLQEFCYKLSNKKLNSLSNSNYPNFFKTKQAPKISSEENLDETGNVLEAEDSNQDSPLKQQTDQINDDDLLTKRSMNQDAKLQSETADAQVQKKIKSNLKIQIPPKNKDIEIEMKLVKLLDQTFNQYSQIDHQKNFMKQDINYNNPSQQFGGFNGLTENDIKQEKKYPLENMIPFSEESRLKIENQKLRLENQTMQQQIALSQDSSKFFQNQNSSFQPFTGGIHSQKSHFQQQKPQIMAPQSKGTPNAQNYSQQDILKLMFYNLRQNLSQNKSYNQGQLNSQMINSNMQYTNQNKKQMEDMYSQMNQMDQINKIDQLYQNAPLEYLKFQQDFNRNDLIKRDQFDQINRQQQIFQYLCQTQQQQQQRHSHSQQQQASMTVKNLPQAPYSYNHQLNHDNKLSQNDAFLQL